MPTLASGGGPAINTGNAAWDQGLGSIFGAMSEGPAKIAQAGYYGAEQRYKQLQSSQLQEQIAAGHQFLGMTTGQMPGKPQYRTDPATGQNILADTAAVWGGSGGPASAPPAASSPPPPPAPISSAVVGPPPGSAPGSAPAPAPASGFQGGGEGGGAGPPAVAPIANLIADSVSKASTSNSGPPLPAASPPAPGLPPAPNTTATDGSTPADNSAGILHPGSFTPAGGGVKTSGPAAPDGSPAPTAVNLGQLVALGVMKGMPAADAMGVARTVVAGWVKNGQMDQQHADDMLADLGETAMRVANIGAASAANVANIQGATSRATTAMTVAGQIAAQNIVTNEKQKEFLDQEVQTAGPDGQMILKKRRDLTPGDQGYDSTIAQIGAKPVQVQSTPGGPVTTQSQAQAQRDKTPVYTPPLSQDQTAAMIQQQIINEPDPAKRADLIQRYQAASPRPPPEEKEVYAARVMNYQSDAEAYPTPQKPPVAFSITAPIAFKADAQTAINARAQSLMDQNRRLDLASAHQLAVSQLMQDGTLYSPDDVNQMRQGTAANLYGRYDAQIQNYAPPGGKPSEHLMVGLKPKGSGGQQQQQQQPPAQTSSPPTATTTPPPPAAAPPGPAYRPTSEIFGSGGGPPAPGTTPGPAPQPWLVQKLTLQTTPTGPAPMSTQQMYGGVSTTPAAPTAAVTAPNQPIARAAPNQRDGEIAYLNGRPIGIVRGGAVYPMPAQAGPGGGG